jgi:Lar family restriction alleviation protein
MSNEKQEADARYYQGLSVTPSVEERLDAVDMNCNAIEERLAKLEEWRKEYEPLMNWEDMAKKKADTPPLGSDNYLKESQEAIREAMEVPSHLLHPDTPPLQPEVPESEKPPKDIWIGTGIDGERDGWNPEFHYLNPWHYRRVDDTDKPEGDELKPCPFCGGKAEMMDYERLKDGNLEFHVDCTMCDCCTVVYDNEAEAIAAWNTRPIEDKLLEIISKLRKRNWEAYLKQAMEEDKNGD